MAGSRIDRRDFLRLAGLTAAAGALAGCAPTTPQGVQTQATAAPQAKPVELVLVWQIIGNQPELFKPALVRWKADYDVPIRWIQTPNIEEQVAKTLSMFVGRETTDVAATVITNFAQFCEAGIFAPLDGMPGLDDYWKLLPASVKSLTQYKGKTMGMVQWVNSQCGAYNKRLLEKGGWKAPAKTWEEWQDHSLKAKRDGLATYPTIWPLGAGIDHGNSVWYSIVGGSGGKITEADGTPILGPGSKAREVLKWWSESFVKTQISDPRSFELRYFPAAKAYAAGNYLYHMGARQYSFPYINSGDSPTVGQHDIFKQPGGPSLITGDQAGVSALSKQPEWAWRLLQYLIGHTKDGDYPGPIGTASTVLTSMPERAVQDPVVKTLWRGLFSIDVAMQTFTDTIAVTEIAPGILQPWWAKWQDTVNVKLQECLKGLITPDAACDAMAAEAEKLRKA